MRNLFIIFFASFTSSLFAQSVNEAELDSILDEANKLYYFEKAAWQSTDLFKNTKYVQSEYGGHFVYQLGDTLRCLILNRSQDKCLHQYSYIKSNIDELYKEDGEVRNLNSEESTLISARLKITKQISKSKYDVQVPEGFNLNILMFPIEKGYRLYILSGTSQNNVIPLGNDYKFESNLKGKITDYKKYHSRIIPIYSETKEGYKVTSAMHSHLKTSPLISPTEICTFRLYAPFSGMKEFKVYSSGMYFKYNVDENKISIED